MNRPQELEVRMAATPAAVREAVAAVTAAERVAFDTEFVSEGSYEPILCLIQLATEAGIWLVDPLAVSDLRELWDALTDDTREMVALAAREEVRFCVRYGGRAPARLLDPQIAAGLLGYGYPLSHTNLVKKALGVNVASGEAFTDWRKRPLSPRQLEYAADDVRHLLALADRLSADARRRGRAAWVEGECRRLVERVSGDPEDRWRVSGSASLNRRDLAVLRELWRWRDQAARSANSPPRRILRDELLVEIARRKPANQADLFALRGMDRGFLQKAGSAIMAAVQAALATPDTDLPRSNRRSDPPQVAVLSQFLSLAASGLAAEHEVDLALLATSSEVQDFVRWTLGLAEPDYEPPLLQGWRGEILGEPLRELLAGQRRVRVRNLKSPNPLVFERTEA
jgi:ribonuclease D